MAAYLKYISTELSVKNKKVIAKTRLNSRKSVEGNFSKVENIEIQQGVMGRMFGFGIIVINGSGASYAQISEVCNPVDFRKHVLEATSDK